VSNDAVMVYNNSQVSRYQYPLKSKLHNKI